MIWHIFRKDMQRLWPLVLGLAVANLFYAVIRMELFRPDTFLIGFARLLGGTFVPGTLAPPVNLINLTCWILAAVVVQLDAIPGDRQDWLVRPLSRRDLLLAKLLFVLAAIQAPLLVSDLAQALGAGASPWLAAGEALARNGYIFLLCTLPGLVLGAMTRSFGQVLLFSAGLCAGTVAIVVIALGIFPGPSPEMGFTFIGWILRVQLFLVAAVMILALQYFRRATLASRLIFSVAMLIIVGTQPILPRSAAYAMQAWLTPPQEFALAFAPEAGKASGPDSIWRGEMGVQRFQVPLKVEAFPAGRILVIEALQAVLVSADGERTPIPNAFNNRLLAAPGKRSNIFYQAMMIYPEQRENLAGAGKLRLEMEFTLAVLEPDSVHTMEANRPMQAVADGLACRSRVNAAPGETRLNGAAVEPAAVLLLQCRQAGQVRKGMSASLAGQDKMAVMAGQDSIAFLAVPNDAPFRTGSDMLIDSVATLSLTNVTRPPAVSITLSRPLAHVTRKVVIEDFRPEDW